MGILWFTRQVMAIGLLLPTSVHALGLLDTYQRAESHEPRFQAEFFDSQAREEVYHQARSALLPQLSVYARQSQISQDIVSSDNEVFDGGQTDYPTTVYGLSLSQSLYDYSRWAAFRQSREEVRQVASELEAARQGLLLRVTERYLEVLALHENVGFLRAERREVEASVALAAARHAEGLAREVDLLDAQARALRVEARELELVNRLHDALNALAEMIGEVPAQMRLIDEELPMVTPSPDSVQAWVDLAVERNPLLKAAGLAQQIAIQEERIRKGGHYPTLDISLNYEDDQTEGSLFGGSSQVQTTELRVTLNVPLYSGGLTSSQVRQARRALDAAAARQRQVRSEVEREVQSAYQGILTAMARERALRGSLQASERIAQTRQLEWESGMAPMVDLLDAERDLFFSRSELAAARYDYVISVLRLKYAAGVINMADLAEIDAMMLEPVHPLEHIEQMAGSIGQVFGVSAP